MIDRTKSRSEVSRRVWDNPVLWRETCTWAYGRKILFIRAVYWFMAIAVFRCPLVDGRFRLGDSDNR